ncbi:MAG: dihydroorotase [bacterium]
MKILIQGGRVIDPANGRDEITDVLIENGEIAGLDRNLAADDARVVDAKGLVVAPGLVDMHVHFREPGYEYKEDIASGSRAASRGGFTAVACMPNTNPPIDNEALVSRIVRLGNDVGLCRVHPIAAITKGQQGKELTEMRILEEAGAVGFSDDGRPVDSARVMRRALEYARVTSKPVIAHCEEVALSAGGHMHEGAISAMLGIGGIPNASEDIGVARDVRLAEITGSRLHVCHVSSARSVEIIRRAKDRGVRVTAEGTPHHFTLTDEAVLSFDANTKMNPPLRAEVDRRAVIEGLADGTLDAIATDHAPHADREKLVEFDQAPFGIIGLETSLGLSLRTLVKGGHLDLATVIERMTIAPARILGIPAGTLSPGAAADLCLFDPEMTWTFEKSDIGSRSHNTPFLGEEMQGRVMLTLLGGRATWEHPGMRSRLGVGTGSPRNGARAEANA